MFHIFKALYFPRKWSFRFDCSKIYFSNLIDALPFDAEDCRNRLKAYYRYTRRNVPLLPGMPERCGDIDNLFVSLQLFQEDQISKEVNKKPLRSYTDLLSLKDEDGRALNRILLKGDAGGGKTITFSKLAHDWATGDRDGPEESESLLFMLDLRKVRQGMTLADAIQDQLLPRTSKKKMLRYIESHAKSMIFLLDGFSEAPWLGKTSSGNKDDFEMLLSNTWIYDSRVLVSTRRHRTSTYFDRFGPCTQVELMQFSFWDVQKLVARFFDIDEIYLRGTEFAEMPFEEIDESVTNFLSERILPQLTGFEIVLFYAKYRETLQILKKTIFPFLKKLLANSKMKCMARSPVLLTMMCMLWKHDQTLPERITDLFEEAMRFSRERCKLTKQMVAAILAESDSDSDDQNDEYDLDTILEGVGEVALNALLDDSRNFKFIFKKHEFQQHFLQEALDLGILVKERVLSEHLRVCNATSFSNRDFQEFCAAKYMAKLVISDAAKFETIVNEITASNVKDLHYLIQFCCGLSSRAAEIILPHVVEVTINSFRKSKSHPCLDSSVSSTDPWISCLLLLAESKTEQLCKYVQPLFQRKPLWIKIGDHRELFPALDYFIQCQVNMVKAGSECILGNIPAAKITVKRIVRSVSHLLYNLLQSLPKLYSLDIEFPEPGKHGFCTYYGGIGMYVSYLEHLKHLTLRAPDNLGLYRDILENMRIPNITHLTLECRNFSTCMDNMRGRISTMQNLTHFSLVGIGEDEPLSTEPDFRQKMLSWTFGKRHVIIKPLPFVADNFLNCIRSEKFRNLSITNYHVSPFYLRRLLPRLNTLHLENLAVKDGKELFHVLHDESKKAAKMPGAKSSLPLKHLRLNAMTSQVSVGSVRLLLNAFRFLRHLTILNLRESQITEEGFKLMAKAFRYLSKLRELNLSNNRIASASKEICATLQQLPLLEKLFLRRANLDQKGLTALSASLHHLKNMKMLSLHGNHIGSAMAGLSPAIQSCENLQELNLSDSELTDTGLSQLPYEHLKNLSCLFISGRTMVRHDEDTDTDADQSVRPKNVMSEGISQCYGPPGVKTLFKNLHHLQKLTTLEMTYNGSWHRNDVFLEECCRNCLMKPETSSYVNYKKLTLKREQIEAVIEFYSVHEELYNLSD